MFNSFINGAILSVDLLIHFWTAGSVCLKFYYHMYGKHMGSLEVVYENVAHFHEAGDKGDQWRTASITLTNTDSTMDKKVFVICIMT